VAILWLILLFGGVALIVWGAESFAENLARTAVQLGVGMFALALLLAGAEPEELATAVTASLRGSPGISIGDVIGANVTICLVALGLGAVIAPLPFSKRVLWYAFAAVPIGAASVAISWSGSISRLEGGALVALYVIYVAVIWRFEHAPPSLGEVGEIAEAEEEREENPGRRRLGRETLLVLAGVGAMIAGAWLLVEGVRGLTGVEASQTTLGITLVGFATGFELVVLAWSAARRGVSDVLVASVIGSFGYNATMTLGGAAVAHPLRLQNVSALHAPLLMMLGALVLVLVLALPQRRLNRWSGVVLLCAYPLFVLTTILVA
jgi:cation:H+ antiporter